jgi:Cu+-exporting ATPase
MVGTGMGAERGILIKNAEVLERIRKLDVIVLDKTGTLTEGRPEVTDIVALGTLTRPALLALAASAESGSEHPLSKAIVDAAQDEAIVLPAASEFAAITARGVTATVDRRQVMAGNRRLFEERSVAIPDAIDAEIERLESAGRTVIVVAVDGVGECIFGIADAVKQNAPRAVDISAQGCAL